MFKKYTVYFLKNRLSKMLTIKFKNIHFKIIIYQKIIRKKNSFSKVKIDIYP